MRLIKLNKDNPIDAESLQEIVSKDVLAMDNIKIFGAADEEKKYLYGVIVLAEEGSILRILTLYVKKEYRRLGIASELLNHILDVMTITGIARPVEAFFPEDEAHESLLKFFEASVSFLIIKETEICHISPECRMESEIYRYLLSKTGHGVSFFSLPNMIQRRFLNKMQQKGMLHFVEDIMSKRDEYIPELCHCVLKEGDIVSVVFVKAQEGKNLEISFGYLQETDKYFTPLICLAHDIEAHYSDYDVFVCAINEQSKKLISGIFKEGLQWDNLVQVRWNGLRMSEMLELVEESFYDDYMEAVELDG